MVTWCIPRIYDPPTSDDGGAHAPIYVVTSMHVQGNLQICMLCAYLCYVDVIGICFIVL